MTRPGGHKNQKLNLLYRSLRSRTRSHASRAACLALSHPSRLLPLFLSHSRAISVSASSKRASRFTGPGKPAVLVRGAIILVIRKRRLVVGA